jgi:nucleoside-diphosphate-sugar epimerase
VRTPLDRAEEVDHLLEATAPDLVLHLSGVVSAAPRSDLVRPTFDSLVVSSLALLRAVDDGRLPRLVLIGSFEEPPAGAPPGSPYGAAKAAMTSYARLHAAWGADVVVVRPAMVYGHGQAADKLLPYIARCALTGVRPDLTSGARLADWVYADDVIGGIVQAAERAPAGSEVDLGTGIMTSTRAVVEALLSALGTDVTPRWGALPDRPFEPSRAAAVEAAEQLIGWRAQHSLDDGLGLAAARWRAEHVA